MIASGIGVVLCRLFAVMLFVQAVAGAGQVIDMFDDVFGKWLLVWVGVFEILTPAVVGALLWKYAEAFSRLSPGTTEAEFEPSLRPRDIVQVGTVLIGLYLLVFGLIRVIGLEVSAWTVSAPDNHMYIWSQRVPAYAQLLLGVLLVLGRSRVAELLLRVRRAGVEK